MATLRSNITKMYILQAIRGFMIMMPVIVPFFQSVGLSMFDIMITQTAFSLSMILFEIPSGYFSDVIGRKRTLITGTILSTVGFGLYCFASGLTLILIAEVVLGLGMAFISGTDSALMYDTLAELGETERSIKSEGRQISFGNFSESLAGIAGGLLAAMSIRYTLYAQVAVYALAIPVAMSLTEPSRRAFHNSAGSLRGIIEISHSALIRDARLRWLLIYSGLIGSATLTMVWFIQPYFQRSGLSIAYFGIVWTAANLSVGLFSMSAHRIEQRFSNTVAIGAMLIAVVAGYLLCGFVATLWAIPFLLLFYFVRGINSPIFNTYINRIVPSDRRATVLSIRQLVARGVFCISGPASGWVADHYSQKAALVLCGIAFGASGALMLLFKPKDSGAASALRVQQ